MSKPPPGTAASLSSSSPGATSGPPPARDGGRGRDAVVVTDARGRVIEWNESATVVFGFEREETLGRRIDRLLLPAASRASQVARLEGALGDFNGDGTTVTLESVATRSSGEVIPIRARVTRTATEPPTYVVSIHDMSGTEPTELSHRQMAAIAHSGEDAMVTLGLDGRVMTWNPAAEEFYGFDAAEAVGRGLESLIVPAELTGEMRQLQRQVAGGEPAERETRRIRRNGSEVVVSVRGVPVHDDDGTVIASAWIARDITDRRGREERQRREEEAQTWRRRIASALEEDRLLLVTQPVIDLRSGEVDHHELLLRMQLGDRLAEPAEFIGEAERSSQIREIDLWVTRRGVELARERPVAINVSARSLGSELLLAEIAHGLRRFGTDPERVTVEITETAGASDLELAASWVERLTDLGCRVALDDFGTGYGAFTYLNRLAVSELKIDREFVTQLHRNEADRRVVATILAVARNFGMSTVAEGVEDDETLAILDELGVDMVQGYLFGHPEIVDREWTGADRDAQGQSLESSDS